MGKGDGIVVCTVVGNMLGSNDGARYPVVGFVVITIVGDSEEGPRVDGASVGGVIVGIVLGEKVGISLGVREGSKDGGESGTLLEGIRLGRHDGISLGIAVNWKLGFIVGDKLGTGEDVSLNNPLGTKLDAIDGRVDGV